MFQDGLNASVTTVESTDGPVCVLRLAPGKVSLKPLEQWSMRSSTESGNALAVPTNALCELYTVLGNVSGAAGVQDVPHGTPHAGQTAWTSQDESLRQDFSIPLSPKPRGTITTRASHHILCWENRVFYPIPVGVLP